MAYVIQDIPNSKAEILELGHSNISGVFTTCLSTCGERTKYRRSGKMLTTGRVAYKNHSEISLVAHAGRILLNNVASRLRLYCEAGGIRNREVAWLLARPMNSYQAVGRAPTPRARTREGGTLLCTCVLHRPTEAVDSVDPDLLWEVLARFGVPPEDARSYARVPERHAASSAN